MTIGGSMRAILSVPRAGQCAPNLPAARYLKPRSRIMPKRCCGIMMAIKYNEIVLCLLHLEFVFIAILLVLSWH